MGNTTLLHMWAGPWPAISIIIILPSKSFWPLSGQLLSSSSNTCVGTCLLWKHNNNLLTYILTIPNLDATWHCWVGLLAGFTFSIEYQKGRGNVVADTLCHVTSKLNAELWSPSWTESPYGPQDRLMHMTQGWLRLTWGYISKLRKLQSKHRSSMCV